MLEASAAMTNQNDNSEWDYENAEVQPPVKNRRAIVSVAFRREEFKSLTSKAKAEGKSLSAYIHDKAMDGVHLPTFHLLMDGEQVQFTRTS